MGSENKEKNMYQRAETEQWSVPERLVIMRDFFVLFDGKLSYHLVTA